MGYKHSKDDILDGALAVVAEAGLARLSFGRVARHLGISDRTVVYYFPTKADLVGEVLGAVGGELQRSLQAAFAQPARDHLDLAARTWPTLASPDADPVMVLFFEGVGLAAAGHAPYVDAMPVLIEAWVAWAETLLDGPDARAQATAAIAIIDGLLLVRRMQGPAAADAAAAQILI